MADIEVIVDPVKDLTIFRVDGNISTQEIAESFAQFYQGEPTRLVMFDASQASLVSNSSGDIRFLANQIRPLVQKRSDDSKTAIVVQTDTDFGLARMYEAFADMEGNPITLRVFKGMDKAEAWLFEG